jgi:signal transduction histidine kinase
VVKSLTLETARKLQLVTVAMLVTCVAQMIYWLWDEATYMEHVLVGQLEQFEREGRAGQDLLDAGQGTEAVLDYFPALVVEGGVARIDLETVDALIAARRRRLIRYGSEGTFLLLVLVGGIATLSHTLRQSAQLMRRQENFIAAVSHEFKTPLASLKLAAETLLLREMDLDSQRRLADRMVQDTERLEAMVSNILEAGRAAEGRLDLRPEALELREVAQRLVERAGCRAHLQGVQVASEVSPGLGVFCDRAALDTVLDNILGNAIKSVAIAGGGTVSLSARAESDQVRIDVEDSGIGFQPAQASRLFEKFYRPGDELRRQTKGSGLGLYIVKTFVEQSGGRVAARSAGEGLGATVSVWLPRVLGGSA